MISKNIFGKPLTHCDSKVIFRDSRRLNSKFSFKDSISNEIYLSRVILLNEFELKQLKTTSCETNPIFSPFLTDNFMSVWLMSKPIALH